MLAKVIQAFPLSPKANLNFMKEFIFKSKEFKKLLLSPRLKKNTSLSNTRNTPMLQLSLKD